MYEPIIKVIRSTQGPAALISLIASQCFRQTPAESQNPAELIRKLYAMGHHSPLEFAHLTVHVTNVSRSFLAQIRTHRHLSFMSSSQHFQNYTDYPIICEGNEVVEEAARESLFKYAMLVKDGVPQHEARQILPNAMGVNMYISGNARAWTHVIRRRICDKNVPEMVTFASRMQFILVDWFPELFTWVNANCADEYMRKCREEKPCKKQLT